MDLRKVVYFYELMHPAEFLTNFFNSMLLFCHSPIVALLTVLEQKCKRKLYTIFHEEHFKNNVINVIYLAPFINKPVNPPQAFCKAQAGTPSQNSE